jgi:hypothetical protein
MMRKNNKNKTVNNKKNQLKSTNKIPAKYLIIYQQYITNKYANNTEKTIYYKPFIYNFYL